MKKGIIIVLSVFVYILPLIIICVISLNEVNNYKTTNIDYEEHAYGEVCPVERRDIKENITISVTAVSNSKATMSSRDTNWMVKEGEEIFKGQTIGKKENTIIKSKENGIVDIVNKNYIVINTDNDIVWEGEVPVNDMSYFREKLYGKKGKKIKVVSISNVMKHNMVRIRFKSQNEKLFIGEQKHNYKLYTGRVMKKVLVVNKKCLVKRKDKYYVRVTDERGIYLYEQEVKVGYHYKNFVCVTNIEEGTYCDTGFSEYCKIK